MKNNTLALTVIGVMAVAALALGLGGILKNTVVQVPQQQQYGSLPGPNIASPWIAWGGVQRYSYHQTFQASSTICAIQNPLNATTTLEFASMNFATTSTYLFSVGIGESLTKNATTTAIVKTFDVPSYLGPMSVNATTSSTALLDGQVPPNGWVNFNLATNTPTSAVTSSSGLPTGDCQVGFRIN